MVIYGYAKDYYYTGDGTLLVRVRIPNVHGPYYQRDYKGKLQRNYIQDSDLPYYESVLLPHLPNDGEVVAMVPKNEKLSEFMIVGLTGGSYHSGVTNL